MRVRELREYSTVCKALPADLYANGEYDIYTCFQPPSSAFRLQCWQEASCPPISITHRLNRNTYGGSQYGSSLVCCCVARQTWVSKVELYPE